jgi:ankyrin repeat protein
MMDGWTPLPFAAGNGHKEIVELLIAEGADVNVKDNNGWTPLHTATKEIAELLIAKGVDVNAKDDFGRTPLDFAKPYPKPPTSSANTEPRRVKNWKLTHNPIFT